MKSVLLQAIERLSHQGNYHVNSAVWAAEIIRLHQEVEDLKLVINQMRQRSSRLTLDYLDLRDELQSLRDEKVTS